MPPSWPFAALGLQYFGIRKVEALVGTMFGLVVLCYMVELNFVKPDLGGVLDGMIPRLWHSNDKFGVGVWLELLCANLGAAVCPPNFFLQSALVVRAPRRRCLRSTLPALDARGGRARAGMP